MRFNDPNPLFNARSLVPKRENPSYGSELPNDFPYDPGQTRSVFELGYVPRPDSILTLVIVGILGSITIGWMLKTKFDLASVSTKMSLAAMLLVFLGPIVFPVGFPFQTTLGFAKTLALGVIGLGLVEWFRNRRFPIGNIRSFIPISFYVLSLLTSVVVMTNPTFFIEDLSLVISGLLFFTAGFMWLWEKRTVSTLLRILGTATLFPSLLVLFIYLFPSQGAPIIKALYPRYETIVFQFDFSRGRILSIIDLEFFAPTVLYLFMLSRNRAKSGLLYLLITFGVLLTNYRYRLLTFLVGSFASLLTAPRAMRKKILTRAGSIAVGVFAVYMIVQTALGNTTIVDRLLLKNYANDVDSLRRRAVMLNQAWNLFLEHPLIGVGLGNYKDNVQVVYESFGGRFYEPYYKILQNVYAYPHNWFVQILAENGIVGFGATLYMLYTFARIDRDILRRAKGTEKLGIQTLVIVSWLYVFANQFTPLSNSLPMVIFFWTFRGILERIYLESVRPEK